MRGARKSEGMDAYNRIRPAHLTLAADYYIYLNTRRTKESPTARKLAGLSVFTAAASDFLVWLYRKAKSRKTPTEPTPQNRIARSTRPYVGRWALLLNLWTPIRRITNNSISKHEDLLIPLSLSI